MKNETYKLLQTELEKLGDLTHMNLSCKSAQKQEILRKIFDSS